MNGPSLATLPSTPVIPSRGNPKTAGNGALNSAPQARSGSLSVQAEVQVLKTSRSSPFAAALSTNQSSAINVKKSDRNIEDQVARSIAQDLINSSNELQLGDKNAYQSKVDGQTKQNVEPGSEASFRQDAKQSREDQTAREIANAQENPSFQQQVNSPANSQKQEYSDTRQALDRQISRDLTKEKEKNSNTVIKEYGQAANEDKKLIKGVQEFNFERAQASQQQKEGVKATLNDRRLDNLENRQEQRDEEVKEKEDREVEVRIRQFERAEGQVFQKLNVKRQVEQLASQNKRVEEKVEQDQYREDRELKVLEKQTRVEVRSNEDAAQQQRVQQLDRNNRAEQDQAENVDTQKRASADRAQQADIAKRAANAA